MLRDDGLACELLSTLEQLLMDPDRLAQMAEQMRALSRPDAADRLAGGLVTLG